MKSILVALVLLIHSVGLLAQRDNPLFFIVTTIDKAKGYEDNGLLLLYSDHAISCFTNEINKELPCVKVNNMKNIAAALSLDRDRELMTGETGYFEEIARAMGADYLININISSDGKVTGFSASMAHTRNGKSVAKNTKLGEGNNEHKLDDIEKFAQDFVAELAKLQLCPFVGKLIMTIDRTSDEIHERGNRCGKDNSGYFRGTIKNSNNFALKLNLEKKGRIKAKGSLSAISTDEKMRHDVNSGCVNCLTYTGKDVTGIDATNYTSSDYTEILREEYKVEGLSRLGKESNTDDNFPAEVFIEFQINEGTYMIRLKAVSNKGIFVKSRKVTNITACQKDPDTDEKVTNEIIVSVKDVWGPFKGKPSDKTLQDSKTETENHKIDGGQTTSTSRVSFSFTR
jgi:hypothetical protein